MMLHTQAENCSTAHNIVVKDEKPLANDNMLADDKMYTSHDSILAFPQGAVCVCVYARVHTCDSEVLFWSCRFTLPQSHSLGPSFPPSALAPAHKHVCMYPYMACAHTRSVHTQAHAHTSTHMHTGAANNIVNTQVDSGKGAAALPGRDGKKGTFVAKWDNVNVSTVPVDRPVCMKLEATPGAATRAEMVLKRQGFLR